MRKGRPQIGEAPREIVTASVSREVAALVRQASDRSGLSRSQVISMALEAFGPVMEGMVNA